MLRKVDSSFSVFSLLIPNSINIREMYILNPDNTLLLLSFKIDKLMLFILVSYITKLIIYILHLILDVHAPE